MRPHIYRCEDPRPLLAESTPPPVAVYAVFPDGGTLVPKTRVFIDALTTWFGKRRQRLKARE
jgi:DNA-binding transcriptional LysR family regulator